MLIVTQLLKKYPAFLRNPKIHHRVHKSPPLNPILSQLNSVRPIDPYLPKVQLISRDITFNIHGKLRAKLSMCLNKYDM